MKNNGLSVKKKTKLPLPKVVKFDAKMRFFLKDNLIEKLCKLFENRFIDIFFITKLSFSI